MTRLTDALERARSGQRPAPDTTSEVVHAWGEDANVTAPESTPAVEPAAPREPAAPANVIRPNRFAPPPPQEAVEFSPEPEPPRAPEPQLRLEPAPGLRPELRPDPALDVKPVVPGYRFDRETAVKLVVGPEANHTLVEQYRHLCAALHHAQLKHGVRTVMVSSAVEAEGKTTTAANIALTLSHSHQRRVLMIDADLRRPSLHSLFQIQNRDGLGDYLRDLSPNRKRPAVYTISPTLSLLTAGRPTQDPMSALVSEEMKNLITEAAEHFDWVIIDTPPVALLSDANLLSAMIDIAVLVVRANSTAYPLVQRAQEAIGPERILGVVLNRARKSDLAVGYGYGYGYYYGYSYGPKDADEKPKGLMSRLFRRGR